MLGGLETPAGESINLTYDLSAGDYLLLNFAEAAPPTILPFVVAEAEDAMSTAEPLPEADVPVELVDFAFHMPTELQAGEQFWSLTNNGTQPHEMAVMRVDDGAELADVTSTLMDAIMAATQGPPDMPYETAVSWSVMSPGERVWANVSLEAGTYVVVCFIPDFTAQEFVTHMQHGMIQLITVSD